MHKQGEGSFTCASPAGYLHGKRAIQDAGMPNLLSPAPQPPVHDTIGQAPAYVLHRQASAVSLSALVFGLFVTLLSAPAVSRAQATTMENFALSPDTTKILTGMGHELVSVNPRNHIAAILIGAPTLGGEPVGTYRFFGANDSRRSTGRALGY